MKIKHIPLLLLAIVPQVVPAQTAAPSGPLSLRQCVEYARENNITLQKDRLSRESAAQSRREIVGSLLPQLSGSAGFTYNIQKTTFAMPNFVNSMMPEPMRDPNASKYMTVTMGMDLSANWGVALSQQLLNFSLFNAVEIARAAEKMSEMGVQADADETLAKTATLYWNTQILEYSMSLFDESLAVMKRMSDVMDANRDNGLVRKVDADRIAVTKMNLETEKGGLEQALEVQKNLLKLEMGFPMTEDITLEPIDLASIESMIFIEDMRGFDVEALSPYKMLKQQQEMLELQRKSAVSETLPVLTLSANYSQNYMGDHFYGETFHHFPVSMVGVNMRIPIFTGMSKSAKIKKARIEIDKSVRDERMLVQSLTMGYNNARTQMSRNRSTIDSQRRNKELAEEVLSVTENNYREGLSTLTDLLNASSSLIQARMNYINALNNCVKAYIDLRKANGTISEIIN